MGKSNKTRIEIIEKIDEKTWFIETQDIAVAFVNINEKQFVHELIRIMKI